MAEKLNHTILKLKGQRSAMILENNIQQYYVFLAITQITFKSLLKFMVLFYTFNIF